MIKSSARENAKNSIMCCDCYDTSIIFINSNTVWCIAWYEAETHIGDTKKNKVGPWFHQLDHSTFFKNVF